MSENIIKMVTIDDKNNYKHTETDALRVYKWLAETMIERHRGGKDITRITYNEQYDGWRHMTFYVSNGVKIEVSIPRS